MHSLLGGPGTLLLHEPRDVPVELELRSIDLKVRGARDSFGEDLPGYPDPVRLAFREVEHGLLGAAELERGFSLVHRLADRLDVGVCIGIEKLQK